MIDKLIEEKFNLKEVMVSRNEKAMDNLCCWFVLTEEYVGVCFDKGEKPASKNSILFKIYPDASYRPKHSQRRIKVIPFKDNPNSNYLNKNEYVLYFNGDELYIRKGNKEGVPYDSYPNPFDNDKLQQQVAQLAHEIMPSMVACYTGDMDIPEAYRDAAKRYKSADFYCGKSFDNTRKGKVWKGSIQESSNEMKLIRI